VTLSGRESAANTPEVTAAAVIGRPDDEAGEIPIAFVVLAHGATSTEDDVRSFVNEQVARYKHFGDVVVIDAIPKSPAGKIPRRQLRDL
jgi:acyl-coenzyme A synthetase/AMP-(fatty) acid ligase